MFVMTELDEQRRRAARNESLAREVNERIEELATSTAFPSFICECPDLACAEKLQVTLTEYERVRSIPNQFIVATGHEVLRVERVIVETNRYVVVAKLSPGTEVAEDLNPRREEP
jgi:hypothetical protein